MILRRSERFPPLRLLLFLLLVARTSGAQQPETCTAGPLPAEVAFDASRSPSLAGNYELNVILTEGAQWGASDHHGKLVLWVQDSIRSHRGMFGPARPGWERPIAGSFVVARPDSATEWWRRMASTSLDHPGVLLQGSVLQMGDHDVFDGVGENLTITHVAPRGFRGVWKRDNGIAMLIDPISHQRVPDPAGYFCARRLPDPA